MSQDPTKTLAAGIQAALLPMAQLYEEKMRAVNGAQRQLIASINNLTAELEAAASASDLPDVRAQLTRLTTARKRLYAVNHTLQTTKERLDRLQVYVNSQTFKEKVTKLAAPILKLKANQEQIPMPVKPQQSISSPSPMSSLGQMARPFGGGDAASTSALVEQNEKLAEAEALLDSENQIAQQQQQNQNIGSVAVEREDLVVREVDQMESLMVDESGYTIMQ